MSVAHVFEDKLRTDDVHISESINFSGLLLSAPILEGLTKSGFKRPSPIQLQAIPLGRCGLDLIVQAKSGTGKTCVFTVIALEGLNLQTDALQVLILAPTREIAIQIRDVVNSIGSCLPELKCHSFIGGTPLHEDKISLKHCHIATGTPGRIKQLIELGVLKTQSIRLFVLDEADKLLGGDLTETINWMYSSLPGNKQILALSATYPEVLAQHLTRYMRNPTFVRLNITDPALIGIKQYHVIVPDSPLPNKVFEAKTEAVVKILSSVSFEQCLIFSNLQTRAQGLQSELQSRNWPTQCIAGCLDQKDRSLAMQHLKAYTCRILISTDLTSRGIDADKVNMVINLDVPLDHETYLHRIGRAGRFGSHGAAISIVSKGKQEKELWAVERKCKTHIPKLPDPIPSDLATRFVALNLSDMVTTEKIITQNDLSFKSLSTPEEIRFGNGGTIHQESYESGRTDIDAESSENCCKNNASSEPTNEENCGDDDRKIGDVASSKNSEIDLCTSSSLEFLSACEEKSLEEDNCEFHSVSSLTDVCANEKNNQIPCSTSIKEGNKAFSQDNEHALNGSQLYSEKPAKSSSLKCCTVENESKSQKENSDGGHECLKCKKSRKTIYTNELEKMTCSCDTNEKDSCQDEFSVVATTGEDLAGSFTLSNDKTLSDCFSLVSSSDPHSNGAVFASSECSGKDKSKVLTERVQPGDSASSGTDKILLAKHRGSDDSIQTLKTSHKPRRQKHPRPFALSAFLKGLNETDSEKGVSENSSQSSNVSNAGVKHLVGTEIAPEQISVKDLVSDCEINHVKEIQELELCPGSIDETKSFQCVDLFISEPYDLSRFQRDSTGEVCYNDKEFDQHNEMTLVCLSQAEKNIEEPFHLKQIEMMSMKESLIVEEEIHPSLNENDFESQNNNKSTGECCKGSRGYSMLFPKRKNPKSFSQLQEDFENFCLNPGGVSNNKVCESFLKPLPMIDMQEYNPKIAVGFHQSSEFSKMADMKLEIKKLVEIARSERFENPNVVRDFLKRVSFSDSKETHNNLKHTQQQGKNKVSKRKKGNGRWNEAHSWRNRGSDDCDWRAKKGNGEDCRKTVSSSSQLNKDFDVLLQQELLLKGKKVVASDEKNQIKDVNNIDQSSHVGKNNVQTIIRCNLTKEAKDNSKIEPDSFRGARPKQLQNLPIARDNMTKSPIKRPARASPDKECQMLDKMHSEMLQRRKERKEKMAGLKCQAASGDGCLGVTNPVDDILKQKITSSVSEVCSKSDKIDKHTIAEIQFAENDVKAVSGGVIISASNANMMTSTKTTVSECDVVSGTCLDSSVTKGRSFGSDGKTVEDCDVAHEKHKNSSMSVTETVESDDKTVSDNDMRPEEIVHSEVHKTQNLTFDNIQSEQVSVGNLITKENKIASSAKANGVSQILDSSHQFPMKTGDCTRAKRSVPQVNVEVNDIDLKGLDLSSDSGDLDLTLSSNTDVSDIDVSIISSDEKVKKVLAARRLKFTALEESNNRTVMQSIKNENMKDSGKVYKRPPSYHHRSKSHPKKNLKSRNIKPDQLQTEKKGKISVVVTDVAHCLLESNKTDPVKAKKLENTSSLARNEEHDDSTTSQKANIHNLELNSSNNKSISGETLLSKTLYHQHISKPSAFLSSSLSFHLSNTERQRKKHIKSSKGYTEFHLSQCTKTKSKQKLTEHSHQTSMKGEKVDTHGFVNSCYNWFWYWLSLYHHSINHSQWSSNLTSINPVYHQLYHYYYHHHQHHQQHSHHHYHQPPLSMRPWLPHYYHHFHRTTQHLPHHYQSTPDCMRHYHNCNDLAVANFQQKYIRHMAHVMKEMTDNFACHQSETDES